VLGESELARREKRGAEVRREKVLVEVISEFSGGNMRIEEKKKGVGRGAKSWGKG